MLTLWLTAVLATVLHLPGHRSAASTLSARRPLPLLNRLYRGRMLPFQEDLTTEMGNNDQSLPNDAFIGITEPYFHGTTRGSAIFQDRAPDMGAVLRRRMLHSQDTYRQVFPGEDGRQSDSVRDRDAEMDEETRMVLMYSLLPRPSNKRARRGGWRSRGRRGKALRAWAVLGGKRQAVLDRMPLSYGRKRSARSAESPLQGAVPGNGAYRVKRDSDDNNQPQATVN